MPKARNNFLDRLVYVAARLVTCFLYCFPISANLRFARWLGNVWYRVDRRRRGIACENIRLSFPGMAQDQIERMARRSMQNFCMLGMEVLFTTRLVRLDTWRRYIELDSIGPTLELLVRKRTGLILLTGHYGNFEILGYVLATLGLAVNAVARPLDNPYVDDWLLGVRERQGQKIIAKRGATAEVAEALEGKEATAFIADQDAGRKGLFVDFFGRPASTYKSIALLAMQYEVPIVVGSARRLGNAFRFRVNVNDIIHPEDWKPQADPVRYITQRFTKAIEGFVREDPDQYLWVHRRWKSQPKA